jgi:hypothetical protein
MMNPSSVSGDGDSLTRTTLQIAGSPSQSALAQIVRALQSVPGVLLADLNPSDARVLVAHDGAVPATALVAAASGAGSNASIVRGPRVPAPAAAKKPDAGPAERARSRHVLVGIAVIGVVLVLVDLLLPDSPHKQLILNGLVLGVWICFFGSIFVRKHS